MTFADLLDHWQAVVDATSAPAMRVESFDITGKLVVRTSRTLQYAEQVKLAANLMGLLPYRIDDVPVRRIEFLPPLHQPPKGVEQ